MGPMLVAQDLSQNLMPGMVITGLYRLQNSPYFYFDSNDAVYTDILAVQYNFDCIAVVADLGGRILPMLLLFYGDVPVVTEIHNRFKWNGKMADETLVALAGQTEVRYDKGHLMPVGGKISFSGLSMS